MDDSITRTGTLESGINKNTAYKGDERVKLDSDTKGIIAS